MTIYVKQNAGDKNCTLPAKNAMSIILGMKCKKCTDGIIDGKLELINEKIKDQKTMPTVKEVFDCYCECESGRRQEWFTRMTNKQVTKIFREMNEK